MTKRIKKIISTSFLIVFLLGYIGTIIPGSIVASLLDIKVLAEEEIEPTILDSIEIENVYIPSSISSNEFITSEWSDGASFTENGLFEVMNVYWENENGEYIDSNTPLSDSHVLYGYIDLSPYEDEEVINNFSLDLTIDDITFNGNPIYDFEVADEYSLSVIISVPVTSSGVATEIETVRVGSATLGYLTGETPDFTAVSLESNLYTVYLERFDEIGSNNFITSNTTYNQTNGANTNFEFEAGKSYSYSIWLKPVNSSVATISNAEEIVINNTTYDLITSGNNQNTDIDGDDVIFYGVPNIVMPAAQSFIQVDVLDDTSYNNGTFTFTNGSAYVNVNGVKFTGALTNGNIQIDGTQANIEVVATPNQGYTATVYINSNATTTAQITNNSTVVVQFNQIIEEERYTLTFNTNGGSYIAPVANQTDGTTINLSSYVPTKTDYLFEGWYSESDLINKITSITLDSDKTVYANWTSLKGNITFSYNTPEGLQNVLLNNVAVSNNSGNGYVVNGYNNVIKIVPQSGYSIVSAQVTDQNSVTTTVGPGTIGQTLEIEVNASTSYTIVITIAKEQTYSLTFVTNGGSEISALVDQPSGTIINLGNFNPTKTDYSFEGWYTESGLVNKITSITLDSDKTVYANWTLVSGDITLTYSNIEGINSILFNNNTVTGTTVHGYITSDNNNTFEIIPEDDYAVTSVQITNASSNTTTGGTNDVNESVTLSVGGSSSYTLVITLTKIEKYTLTFQTNGGSTITAVQNILEGTEVNLNNYITTKTDYSFEGWYSESGLVNKITSITMDSDKTVYANWTLVSGDITLTYNTPTGLAEMSFNNGTVTGTTVHGYVTSANKNTISISPEFLGGYTIVSVQVTDALNNVSTFGPAPINEILTFEVNGSTSYSLVITIVKEEIPEEYNVTYNIPGLISSNTATTITAEENYTTILSVDSSYELSDGILGLILPKSILVKVGNIDLLDDNYSYNSTTGALTISKLVITDDVTIIAPALGKVRKPVLGTNEYNYNGQPVNLNITNYDERYMERTGSVSETNAGNYQVTFTLSDPYLVWADETGEPITFNWKINKANINPTVIMSDWKVGSEPSTPVTSGNLGNADEIIEYKPKTSPDTAYTTVKPTAPGVYTVRYIVLESQNYNAGSATDDFTISTDRVVVDLPLLVTKTQYYNGFDITIDDIYDSNYISRYYASAYEIGEHTTIYHLKDSNYEWPDGSKSDIELKWNIKYPTPEVVTSSKYNSVTLTWDELPDAYGYQVYECNSKGESCKKLNDATALKYTKSSLKFNTKYYYKVRGYTKIDGKKTYGDYTPLMKVTTKLNAPTLKASTNRYQEVKLTWNKESGTEKYYIYKCDEFGEGCKELATTTSTSYADKKAKEAGYSYYKVRAYKSKKYSAYSNLVEGYRVNDDLVVSVKNTGYLKNTIYVDYKPGATFYEIYKSTDGKKYTLLKSVDAFDVDEYYGLEVSDKKAKFNKKTYYQVRVNNGVNYSAYVVKNVTAKYLNPPEITASSNRYQEVKLTWPAVSGAEKYYIYKCDEFGDGCKELGTSTSTKYSDKKAKEGAYSYYKVKTYKEKKYSAYSNLAEGYRENDDLIVTIKNTDYLTNTIKIERKEYAIKYEIYKSTDNKTYSLLKTISLDDDSVDPFADFYEYVDKKNTYNKKTYYKVRVHNGVNYSAYFEKNITNTKLKKPVVSVNGTLSSPEFSVSTVTKATGYEFYHSFDNEVWTKDQKSTKKTFKKVYDEYDEFYYPYNHYYKVRAYRTEGSKTYYSDYVYISELDFY